MEWDPHKKRFFKKPPAKARIKSPRVKKISRENNAGNITHIEGIGAGSLARSPFAMGRPLARLGAEVLATQTPHLMHAYSLQRRKLTISHSLANARHVSTTSIIPWSRRGLWAHASQGRGSWSVQVTRLDYFSQLGAFLLSVSGSNLFYSLDTAHVQQQEPSSALGLSSYLADSMPEQNYQEKQQLRETSDRLLQQAEVEGFQDRITGNLLVRSSKDMAHIYHIYPHAHNRRKEAPSLAQQPLCHFKFNHGPEEIQHLCAQEIVSSADGQDSVAVFVTSGRSMMLLISPAKVPKSTPEAMLINQTRQRYTHHRIPSDIICLEMLPSTSITLVGLRNGTVLRCAPAMKSSHSKGRDQNLIVVAVEVSGSGAVTHIRAVTRREAIVAFSSGEILLVDLNQPTEPLMRYKGHNNSWTLNLPMTLDVQHRLLAVAGQDRKVRIWSLDHPLHLQASQVTNGEADTNFDLGGGSLSAKILDRITFSAPITGLTFCPRRQEAAMESSGNLIYGGIPGLAVACGGSEIAFFE